MSASEEQVHRPTLLVDWKMYLFGVAALGIGAGEGNSTRSLTRLLRTFFPIQASRNGLDCGLKSSAWSTQAVAGDPKRAKHIYQQPEHRISFRSLSVHRHITPQAATDRRAASSKDRQIGRAHA